MESSELAGHLTAWCNALAAENKSPQTVKAYLDGVTAFLKWAARTGTPPDLDRPTVAAFTAFLLGEQGNTAGTARLRQYGVRAFSKWLADEDRIERDELLGMKPPKLGEPNVPRLTDAELVALIRACQGKEFLDRRDEAIVRLAVETAARAEEILAMRVPDIDTRLGMATIIRGKGGRGRRVPFGPKTAQSVDRYLWLRKKHRHAAATGALWLRERGAGLGYYGLRNALQRRAEIAGIEGFHIHRLRHTAASRWLDASGSEGGLMAVAGWKRREMLDRYVRDTAMSRAAEESRALNLGDL